MKNLLHQILVFLTQKILKKFRDQYQKATQTQLKVILVAGNIGKTSQTLFLNQAFESLGFRVWSGTTPNKNRNTLTGLIMTLGQFESNLEQVGVIQKAGFMLKAFQVWVFKTWDFSSIPNILIYEVGVDRLGEMGDFVQVFQEIDWAIISNFGPEHTVGFPADFDDRSFRLTKASLGDLYRLNPELDFSLELTQNPISGTLKNCYLEQLKLLVIAQNYILPADLDLSGAKLLLKQKNNLEIIQLNSSRQTNQTLICSGFVTPRGYLLPQSFARQIAMTQILAQNFGGTEAKFQQVLDTLILPNGRFGFFEGLNQSKIVDSSYNADPASLDSFLQLLLELQPNLPNPTKTLNYLILGEMRELGNSSAEAHQKILRQLQNIAQTVRIKVILLGTAWLDCDLSQLGEITQHFDKVGAIIAYFKTNPADANTWFWVKGSQNTIFLESLVASLLANPQDQTKLARRGQDWDLLRRPWCQ